MCWRSFWTIEVKNPDAGMRGITGREEGQMTEELLFLEEQGVDHALIERVEDFRKE